MTKKTFTIAILTTILIAGTIFILGKESFLKNQPTSPSSADSKAIVFSPPTEDEVKAGDEQKTNIPNETATSTPTQNATVVIVDASQYDTEIEVRAFVSSHIQDGMCRVIFSKNSTVIERTVKAVADARTTPCMNLTIPSSELGSKGTWQVEVIYTSASGNLSGKASRSLEVR